MARRMGEKEEGLQHVRSRAHIFTLIRTCACLDLVPSSLDLVCVTLLSDSLVWLRPTLRFRHANIFILLPLSCSCHPLPSSLLVFALVFHQLVSGQWPRTPSRLKMPQRSQKTSASRPTLTSTHGWRRDLSASLVARRRYSGRGNGER